MKFTRMLTVISAGFLATASAQAQDNVLRIGVAGDQNLVDYVLQYLAPEFEAQNEGVRIQAIGTGSGDAGDIALVQKLQAQAAANVEVWDLDVLLVKQRGTGTLVSQGLLAKYADNLKTRSLSTNPSTSNALGVDVEGYVMPVFQSQLGLAYNSGMVEKPPASLSELADWAKANPQQFSYPSLKGGLNGVGFATAWLTAFSDLGDRIQTGPYTPDDDGTIRSAFAKLKEFNSNVVVTASNAATLDMLNRGEVAMATVWVDQFYSWVADGRLPEELRLTLPTPYLPGQPQYFAIPAKSGEIELATRFIEFATSPEAQAKGIVERFNWYPGIDAKNVEKNLDPATWKKLFSDISPEMLAANSRPFAQTQFFTRIVELYEQEVAN